MIKKKLFRSEHEAPVSIEHKGKSDTSIRVNQRVSEVKLASFKDKESVWDVIKEMSDLNYHQIIIIDTIMKGFILASLNEGASLTNLTLSKQDVEELPLERPQQTLLGRFLGTEPSSEDIRALQKEKRVIQEEKRAVQITLEEKIREQIRLVNDRPFHIIDVFNQVEDECVSELEMEFDGQYITIHTNGLIMYEDTSEQMLRLEKLLIEESLAFFTPYK
jgi:hypothetical protein